MGKTSLIQTLIVQDIENDHGVFFLDPHGEAIDQLITYQSIADAYKKTGYRS